MSVETSTSRKRPSLRDVAEDAHVAVSTVSRYVNGQLALKPDTELRVLKAIEELGYSAQSARTPRSKALGTGVIGLVVPRIGDLYFAQIAQNVVSTAEVYGLSVIIASAFHHESRQLDYVELLASNGVDGIIYAGDTASNRALAGVVESGMPVVLIDEAQVELPPVDAVVVDDYAGAHQATAHLTALGHRHIALVTGPADMKSVRERTRGWSDALMRANIDPGDQLTFSGTFSEEFGIGVLSHLLAGPVVPTAVFAASDVIALGIMIGARNLGIRIPEELSVVGFDGTPSASYISPRLTTVHTPIDKMAANALRMLLENIGSEQHSARTVVTPVALVVGQSSAPPDSRGR